MSPDKSKSGDKESRSRLLCLRFPLSLELELIDRCLVAGIGWVAECTAFGRLRWGEDALGLLFRLRIVLGTGSGAGEASSSEGTESDEGLSVESV
jgi:hypothetical protein